MGNTFLCECLSDASELHSSRVKVHQSHPCNTQGAQAQSLFCLVQAWWGIHFGIRMSICTFITVKSQWLEKQFYPYLFFVSLRLCRYQYKFGNFFILHFPFIDKNYRNLVTDFHRVERNKSIKDI